MKKKIISLLSVLLLCAFLAHNFSAVRSNTYASYANTQEGILYLEELSSRSVKDAESSIKAFQDKYNSAVISSQTKKAVEKSLSLIKKGEKTYKNVFRNVYFAGDSLIAGLESYDILNKKKIYAQVSASLYHLEENLPKITSKNPKVLILHYGINMIATEKVYLNSFIAMYTRLIKDIQEKSPETRIIVSLIFPVDRSVAKAERFGKINSYNKALKKMCNSLSIEYLDSSSVLKAHPECYGSDGIHQSKVFYSKYWLSFIMKEKGIY